MCIVLQNILIEDTFSIDNIMNYSFKDFCYFIKNGNQLFLAFKHNNDCYQEQREKNNNRSKRISVESPLEQVETLQIEL